MAGVSGITGAQSISFGAEYQARVLSLQKDAMNMQGQMAIELINAAVVSPQSGQQLNVTA